MRYSLEQLNQMSQAEFVEALGAVFEHTPTIAQVAWNQRPFADRASLYQCLVDVMQALSREQQLALIRAHPDLGSKAKMAAASVQEQAGVGLDRLTAAEYHCFQALNQAYQEKFGFPFIVAVKHHTKSSILEAFEQRLNHPIEQEIQQALIEIEQIAHFRLQDLVQSNEL
ncbi:2-oxo-4-hydroxy-4-carboxy-5-ureidoimidazoline decarboxylase [Pantanalinema sp. GBBB05]|uniref:2-oxo-4-hydroxy-4-carboxy-5-ureidoimidazoline decarboxylase n=1 Tax=Pantanalinema sp. GBBB05 TaxID=2604139 RepID=UPI001E03CEFE|nr:2-oxo-4-hydroxy-4-carboxy-5-ureidoimidazoline decarboxylase [Pantanalinema sp. GBBB05]